MPLVLSRSNCLICVALRRKAADEIVVVYCVVDDSELVHDDAHGNNSLDGREIVLFILEEGILFGNL